METLWRGVFYRHRGSLIFIAFGFRDPDFYRKLERLRRVLADGDRYDRNRV